jgi:RNA polymerase sigma-70 factor (ECF subfamily)
MAPGTPPPESTDAALAARGDLGALYERYQRRLLAFLSGLGVARDDLEDVQHEVWVRVCNHLRARGFEGHFRGWLFKIARRLVIDGARRKRPETLPADDSLPSGAPAPEEALRRQEELERLRHCLDRLPPQQAAVVRARLRGETYPDLSRQLGVAVERAHRLFHDAGKALAICVERAGP